MPDLPNFTRPIFCLGTCHNHFNNPDKKRWQEIILPTKWSEHKPSYVPSFQLSDKYNYFGYSQRKRPHVLTACHIPPMQFERADSQRWDQLSVRMSTGECHIEIDSRYELGYVRQSDTKSATRNHVGLLYHDKTQSLNPTVSVRVTKNRDCMYDQQYVAMYRVQPHEKQKIETRQQVYQNSFCAAAHM